MAISKTDADTYRVEVFYPTEIRAALGVKSARYRKTVATKTEAKQLEKRMNEKIALAKRELESGTADKNGEILFEEFYQKVWWPLYAAGGSGRRRVVPSKETQDGTKLIFRKHLLPLFGKFSLNYLNSNKQFVIEEFTIMSEQFANIRTFKAYFGQLFEVAEIMDYIDYNRIEKALKLISSPKQARLATRRKLLGESLTADELVAWLDAAKEDVENGKLKPQDYLLFLLTLHLGDRKAESYGLQWKHVDFNSGYVMIVQSLKKVATLVQPRLTRKQCTNCQRSCCHYFLNGKRNKKNSCAPRSLISHRNSSSLPTPR